MIVNLNNREVKFRTWCPRDKTMDDMPIIYNGKAVELDIGYECVPKITPISPQPHIMQYTGFKDKHDKEIYEGDIVKYIGSLRSISFECGCFCVSGMAFEFEGTYWNEEDMEVIGNIYENPELLNKDTLL